MSRDTYSKHLPRILWTEIPNYDADIANIISGQLATLSLLPYRFETILELFDFCEHGRERAYARREEIRSQFPGGSQEYWDITSKTDDEVMQLNMWQQIAGRDGGLTIWDIATCMYRIRANRDKWPGLRDWMNRGEMEKALKSFSNAFPDAEEIRNAFAHPIDLASTPKRRDENTAKSNAGVEDLISVSGDGSLQILLGGIFNRKVTVTIYGKILHYELDRASLRKLADITKSIFLCFKPVADKSFEAFIARTSKPSSA